MSMDELLLAWVHGDDSEIGDAPICYPDYSCCYPELLAPIYERARFYQAYKDKDVHTGEQMHINFHTRMLVYTGEELGFRDLVPSPDTTWVH